jgi:acetyl/propionyl-CoA carboxylase alpha subunit
MDLLVANRGEIAIRILQAAAELGIRTVAVHSEDDANSLHTRKADEVRPLRGSGAAAYLDAEQLVACAREARCDAIHPGYGFLSEDPRFARRCVEAGITFVGPRPELLELFGDKVRGRGLAERCGVPVLGGTTGPTSVAEATAFLESLADREGMLIKAVAGGGGRGLRVVRDPAEVEQAHARCRSEAMQAFGNGDVYVERLMEVARHIEVQVVGDATGAVGHLGERECTIQRRHQKLVEMAPSPWLSPVLREQLVDAAVRMAQAVGYDNVGTFEFLVDAAPSELPAFAFIEANPRLQVEHTVTEEVTGIDLVRCQLGIAEGRSLAELGLGQADVAAPRGMAMQVRINMETMGADGTTRPAGGVLTAFEVPSGPGIRVDSFGYVGYRTNPSFDSLLAKLIGHTPSHDLAAVAARTYRALCEFKIEGVSTNVRLLQSLLTNPDFLAGRVHTRFVEDHIASLVAGDGSHRRLFFDSTAAPPSGPAGSGRRAGASVDRNDPLAVLDHGKTEFGPGVEGRVAVRSGESDLVGRSEVAGVARAHRADQPDGTVAITAPIQGTVVSIDVAEGDLVHLGGQVAVMEAMKMEHVVTATKSGVVRRLAVAVGDTIFEGDPLAFVEEAEVIAALVASGQPVDLDALRDDLAEVHQRHAVGLDAARPDAVQRRQKTGQRTTRENVADLCDPGTFVEYGPLVIAAQRRRRSLEDLIERTPADGMVAGIGSVNGISSSRPRPSASSCRTTTPCWPVPRACRTIARRTACSRSPSGRGCPSCSSPRVAVAGPAIPTGPGWPVSTAWHSICSGGSADWSRWSASSRAGASPAMPRCWAVAT